MVLFFLSPALVLLIPGAYLLSAVIYTLPRLSRICPSWRRRARRRRGPPFYFLRVRRLPSCCRLRRCRLSRAFRLRRESTARRATRLRLRAVSSFTRPSSLPEGAPSSSEGALSPPKGAFSPPEGAPEPGLSPLPVSLVDSFLGSIDPIAHFHALLRTSALQSCPRHSRSIMAQGLVAAANLTGRPCSYGTPTHTSIYISQKNPELAIVIDTGASFSVTPSLTDFISSIRPATTSSLKSLNSNIEVHGEGTVEWEIQDVTGQVRRIRTLKQERMPFNVEDDVAGFLGVHIEKREDGTIHLTQTGLIKRIVEALNIDHLPPKRTPARTEILGTDPNGEPSQALFNYASVIGMLGYLQGHSRPDITQAVSQCARFTHSPKRSHEEALMRIGQYLKGTADKGLILKPKELTDLFDINIYVDAAFAVGWGSEDPDDPVSVKSRTGYMVEVMGCPVIWASKLQANIATSTMESEYTALSMALREAIPLQQIIKFVLPGFGLPKDHLIQFSTTLHEDNEGALKLARMESGRTTPRSKFYAIRYHWFRSWLKPNEIELKYIPTEQQKADIFTKPLSVADFEANRKLTCGW